MRPARTIAAAPEPAAYRLNMLLVDVAPMPVVEIVYDPQVPGSSALTVRVYRTIDLLAFTPGDPKGVLYLPHVTAGGTPMGIPPRFGRVEIQTAIDPDFPLDTLYYRTMVLTAGAAVPGSIVRHRLLLPGTTVNMFAGSPLINSGEVDDSFVFNRGRKTLYTIHASNGSVEFDVRWKRVRSGIDPGNPRDFFLQLD